MPKTIIQIGFVVHEGRRLLCQQVREEVSEMNGVGIRLYWEPVPTLSNVNVEGLTTK